MAGRRDSPTGKAAGRVAHWQAVVADWSESGLSQRAYCARMGIRPGTFAWWKHELFGGGRKRSRRRPSQARFVRVEVRPSTHPTDNSGQPSRESAQAVLELPALPTPLIELLLPTGIRVRIGAGCESELLGRVLSVLPDGRC